MGGLDLSQHSECNLSKQTAISAIRLQSQQSDCKLSNQTEEFRQLTYTLGHPTASQSDCNLRNPTAISTIQLQSPQSDCKSSSTYIYSWSSNGVSVTAISTIQLQSPQSNCNLHNQSAKVPQLTYTVGHPTACR